MLYGAILITISQQSLTASDFGPMLHQCQPTVYDAGPTLNQWWVTLPAKCNVDSMLVQYQPTVCNASLILNQHWFALPANAKHWPNVVSRLGHRLRRWPNLEPALGESLWADGWCLMLVNLWVLSSGQGGYRGGGGGGGVTGRRKHTDDGTSRMSNQTKMDVQAMVISCRASVADGGPARYQHWINVLCLSSHIPGNSVQRKIAVSPAN